MMTQVNCFDLTSVFVAVIMFECFRLLSNQIICSTLSSLAVCVS